MAVLLGPVRGPAGDLLLVAPLPTRGVKPGQNRTRLVVDDFGDAVAYQRRCVACKEWLPLTLAYFATRKADRSFGMHSTCTSCVGARKTMERKYEAERVRARNRASYKRRMQDPAYRQRLVDRVTANRHALRDRDPEAFYAQNNALAAKYRAELSADPQRHARLNETRRINYRLRQEQEGRPLDDIRSLRAKKPTDKVSHLPARPLAAFLLARVAVLDLRERMWSGERTIVASPQARVCGEAGIWERQLWAWASGEIANIRFNTVDSILQRLGLMWWDIYDPAEHQPGVFHWRQRDDVLAWIDAAEQAVEVFDDQRAVGVAA